MCTLFMSLLKDANVDIHMTPQNALLGVSLASGSRMEQRTGSYAAPEDEPI